MRLQVKVRLVLAAAVLLASVVAVVLVGTFGELHHDIARVQHMDAVVKGAFELRTLTDEYLADALPRAEWQWLERHRGLGYLLTDAVARGDAQHALLDRIRRNHAYLGRVFADAQALVRGNDSGDPAAQAWQRKRLVTRMNVGLLGMIAESDRLFGELYTELKDHQRVTVYVVAASTLVMVCLLLATAEMISRSAVRPLAALQHSTEAVGGGDLSYRVGLNTQDEVGDLSRAFDRMTERLEQTTASRDDLAHQVAERKKAEARLTQALTTLERSNQALAQFAYVASHDLQEPLRKIRAFGGMLEDECGDQLGVDGHDYMARMLNAAKRMQQLIGDLLALSRITTRGKPFAPVAMGQVLADVLSDLETRIEETGGQVDVSELPTIDADETQMRQLFQNLLGNALKFNREGVPPRIKVRAAEAVDGSCRVEVADNGIGFDEKYTDRIFGVFQRLHSRSEYEGSGIGLSVCRKIVERHGGVLDVRSTPGEGTVFAVTLPVVQVEPVDPGDDQDGPAGVWMSRGV